MHASKEPVEIPLGYPTSTFYLDDSGIKAGGSRLLVIGGLKMRRHGQLLRAIRRRSRNDGLRSRVQVHGHQQRVRIGVLRTDRRDREVGRAPRRLRDPSTAED